MHLCYKIVSFFIIQPTAQEGKKRKPTRRSVFNNELIYLLKTRKISSKIIILNILSIVKSLSMIILKW